MARTYRYNNGINKGRDDKKVSVLCGADTSNPRGFNTFDDDHGQYGASGARAMKREASAARRIYNKKVLSSAIHSFFKDE